MCWVCVNNYGSQNRRFFIIEHYFRSYGVGCQNGPSLRHVREHYEEQFNKTALSNKTTIAIVEKFHRTGSVLCQRKGTTGRPRTSHHKRESWTFPSHSPDLMAPDAYIWGMLKESVFRSDDPAGNVPNYGRRYSHFLLSLQQPVHQHSNNLKDGYEQCVRREGTHFEHMLYQCI